MKRVRVNAIPQSLLAWPYGDIAQYKSFTQRKIADCVLVGEGPFRYGLRPIFPNELRGAPAAPEGATTLVQVQTYELRGRGTVR